MSTKRRDLHKAKPCPPGPHCEKHGQHAGPAPLDESAEMPELPHPFAPEREMRAIQALLEGQKFTSIDEINAKLAELTRCGQISKIANAWMQDDPRWRAQELAFDALETDDVVEAIRLCNEARKLDPDCTDAQRLMVSVIPETLENRIRLMRCVVEIAEASLGQNLFEEQAGHFWGIVWTRPYMRAKQYLGELLAEAGNREEAIAIFERMLELNPDDNLGMRRPLIALYLAINRPEAADTVLSRYAGEEGALASAAWARVLERWLAGELGEAEATLAKARKVNPYVERYISGAHPLPRETPAYFRPGDESEAQVCASELAPAWKAHRSFCEWLQARR